MKDTPQHNSSLIRMNAFIMKKKIILYRKFENVRGFFPSVMICLPAIKDSACRPTLYEHHLNILLLKAI